MTFQEFCDDNVPSEYYNLFADTSLPNPPNYKPDNDEPSKKASTEDNGDNPASDELADLKRQLAAMQAQLENLSKK